MDEYNEIIQRLAIVETEVKNWIYSTEEYRKLKDTADNLYKKASCDKLDKVLQWIETTNRRCIEREPDYTEIRKFLANSEEKKSIWHDRQFRIFTIILAAALGSIFWFLQHSITKEDRDVRKSITTIEKNK